MFFDFLPIKNIKLLTFRAGAIISFFLLVVISILNSIAISSTLTTSGCTVSQIDPETTYYYTGDGANFRGQNTYNEYLEYENVLWSSEFDMTKDSRYLFNEIEQIKFDQCFNNIKVVISVPSNPKQKMDNLPVFENKLDSQLKLDTLSSTQLIRSYETSHLEFKHILSKIPNKPIIKQDLELYNPSSYGKTYLVNFVVDSPFKNLNWNDEFLDNSVKGISVEIPNVPNIINLYNDKYQFHGSFDWSDLINEGFDPKIIISNNGQTVIECQLEIDVLPNTAIHIDPSYVLSTFDDLKIFHNGNYSNLGKALAVGDFNNDGFSDMIFAAPEVDIRKGEIYIVFGKTHDKFGNYMNFSYSEDVTIKGASIENSLMETEIVVGNINNDDYDDIIIGAPTAKDERGLIYVIFGKATFKKKLDLGLTSDYDIAITGPELGAKAGTGLAIGDVNGDNFGDLIIGAPWTTFPNGTIDRENCGIVYVIYGNSSMNSIYKLWDDTNYNIRILGDDFDYAIGQTLASGDINNDGFDDIVIGSPDKSVEFGDDRRRGGQVDIIFGRTEFPKLWDLLNFNNFTALKQSIPNTNLSIIGADKYDRLGSEVFVDDINNDEYDDILIGVPESYGKNNIKSNSGEIYIIYGDEEENLKPNQISIIDARNMSRDGYIIYGKDPGDFFGSSIAAGDIDGDSIKDILVGAPGARGVNDDADQTGEVYVFYGTSEKNKGFFEVETNLGNPGLIIIYGIGKYERAGEKLASADIDMNGKNEIIISAPDADSANGLKISVGRIDVIFTINVTARIAHIDFKLVNGGGESGNICYAGKKQIFRIRVFNSLRIENLNFTQLSLSPSDLNIRFKWYSRNNTFLEEPNSDKNDYTKLDITSCVARKINDTLYELDFVIIFNFTYPAHLNTSCQVYSLGYNLSIPAAINQYKNIYSVENELKFIGNLVVRGSSQGLLSPGDRVHSGERIIWTGLRVVFNGTEDVYPEDEYFDVTVWDDDGESWSDRSSSGKDIVIESIADLEDDESDIHTINITNIAGFGFSHSEVKFELRIVSIKIEFTNPKPSPGIWQNKKDVACGITIKDSSGWRIIGESVEYSVSTNGNIDSNFGPWTSAGVSGLNSEITVTVNADFENGINNFIRWRVKNEASDIFSGSIPNRIFVDLEGVNFTDPKPNPNIWQYNLTVNCGITIYDNLSGVNPSSIMYRYSTTGTDNYSPWMKNDLNYKTRTISTNSLFDIIAYDCEVQIIGLSEGENNYIQWQAMDYMNNSAINSENNQIKVTRNIPISILNLPKDEGLITSFPVNLIWTGIDPNQKQLTYDLYLSTDLNKILVLNSSALYAERISNSFYNISNLYHGRSYYWTVIPSNSLLTGKCQSGIWRFKISLPEPNTELILPRDNSIVISNSITFIWKPIYLGIEEIIYDFYFGEINPPTEPIKKNLVTNSLEFNNLINGKTYYWTVVPRAQTLPDELIGYSTTGVVKFTVDFDYKISQVQLLKPKNNTYVVTDQPTLEWRVKNSNDVINNNAIEYLIFLDSTPNPSNVLTENIKSINYSLKDDQKLKFNTTYYWRVHPYLRTNDGIIEGKISDISLFSPVKIAPKFKIDFELSKTEISANEGKKYNIKFFITNQGEINDQIMISYSQFNNELELEIAPIEFDLEPGQKESGVITITVPKKIENNTYNFEFIATSIGSTKYDIEIQKNINLTVKITEPRLPFNYGIIIAAILLIIIIIFLGYAFMAKSRIDKEKEQIRAGTIDSKKTIKKIDRKSKSDTIVKSQPTQKSRTKKRRSKK